MPRITRTLANTEHESAADDDLESALRECREAARRGYQIAKENQGESTKAIGDARKSLSQCLKSLEGGSVRTPDIEDQLKAQLSGVVNEFEQLQQTSDAALEERREHLDDFSVTLFGRTMAGKSTLMEILTRGDGQSIGMGAQRTTRDVRAYYWNGLEVTDVPGVAAFGGAEDEELAFAAASRADLVLFLITDDAPQPAEAECLARVRGLGKPMLGICNVKVAIDDDVDLVFFLRNPDLLFDRTRLDQLINQFQAFADQHVPGKRVPFMETHLLARFLAQQPQFVQHRDQLLAASRFDVVESHVVREVIEHGTFLRVKSFADFAAVPMMDLMELLLESSAQNSSSGRVLIDKRRQLYKWSREFQMYGRERINTLASKTMETLRDEVPSLAEYHYEDRLVGERWATLVEGTGVNRSLEKLRMELLEKCDLEFSEVAKESKSELALVARLSGDRHITMGRISNLKRTLSLVTNSVALGLSLTALIRGGGPLGQAAGVVSNLGSLSSESPDDREKEVRSAREELTKLLLDDIDKIDRKLRKSLGDWFHHELLGKRVDMLLNDLRAVTSGLFELADAQRTLAWTLNDRQKELGRTLVEEALVQLKAENLKDSIVDIARVPGVATMFLIAPNTTFPGQVRDRLERLLGEKIWFVVDTKIQFSILAQAIGRDCDRHKISIEEKIRVAHVPLDDLGPVAKVRVRLAQQLTGLHVMR